MLEGLRALLEGLRVVPAAPPGFAPSLPPEDADEDEHDFHTTAGMVIAHFGRIPHVGERFSWPGWEIEVIGLDGPRIDKVLLQRHAIHDPANDDTNG